MFRAVDGFLDTEVALKILLPEQLDGVGRDRFRREAELGERLTCPHSVRLHAHGEDELGMPYIAFELLEGQSLSSWLSERGPQTPESTARIARAALEALAEAHDLGMVHRDIKPANIHLCSYGGHADFVKVLDFGIAKRSARDATQLTAADVVVGTARYMAPEQLRGEEISPATDLYSLGLVMAELLAGEPVFRGTTIDVCIEQVSPRSVPLTASVRGSPLGALIARATDKDPGRRFQSARELLAALPVPGHRATLPDDEPTQVVHESSLEHPADASGGALEAPPRRGATVLSVGAAPGRRTQRRSAVVGRQDPGPRRGANLRRAPGHAAPGRHPGPELEPGARRRAHIPRAVVVGDALGAAVPPGAHLADVDRALVAAPGELGVGLGDRHRGGRAAARRPDRGGRLSGGD